MKIELKISFDLPEKNMEDYQVFECINYAEDVFNRDIGLIPFWDSVEIKKTKTGLSVVQEDSYIFEKLQQLLFGLNEHSFRRFIRFEISYFSN